MFALLFSDAKTSTINNLVFWKFAYESKVRTADLLVRQTEKNTNPSYIKPHLTHNSPQLTLRREKVRYDSNDYLKIRLWGDTWPYFLSSLLIQLHYRELTWNSKFTPKIKFTIGHGFIWVGSILSWKEERRDFISFSFPILGPSLSFS